MKPKKLIFPMIVLLCLAFIFGYFRGKTRGIEEVLIEHELKILSHDKQIPFITEYIKLVRELQEVSKGKLSPFHIVEIAKIITIQCQINQDVGLEPEIVMALIERESSFNPNAISKAKAYGLTQCIRPVFDLHLPELGYGKFSVDLALNPIVNIEVGIKHLIYLRKYWLSEGIDSWLITTSSYYWGIRHTWDLLTSKKRARLPSLEYGKGIIDLANKWKEKGL